MPKIQADLTRRCIVSGSVLPTAELIRCVAGPDGIVVPDVDEKLPGRGLWLSATLDVVNKACAKNSFARAAKANVKPMDGLTERIETALTARCLSLISMMRREGKVVFGFEKTRSRLKGGQCAVILAASDGAADGRSKIQGLVQDRPLVALFTGREMGQVVGRDYVVHMGLDASALVDRFLREAKRLQGFRQ